MANAKPVIVSQYKASLAMLRDAIERCSEALWNDARHKPPFWRIAYHVLFYTDNIRHVQHHAGQLHIRLREEMQEEIEWIGNA